MKMSNYKTCAVPMCKSTTIKNPDKLFIYVPKCPKRRKQWLQLARRNRNITSAKSTIYFCGDHFDLPNNMENYIQYSLMGSVGKIRMKPDCLPSKFQCQPDRIKRTMPPQPRSAVNKRRRKDMIQEILAMDTDTAATSGITSNCAKKLDNNKLSNDMFCTGCKKTFQGCMLVCVQCPECVWCAQCAELSSHARHYLVQVPAGRPQKEIDEVINTIKTLISKHTCLEIKIEPKNYEFRVKTVIKQEQCEFNEMEDWNVSEEVTTKPCDLDVGQVTRDEEIVMAVKSEVEDPLLVTAGDETLVMLIELEPDEATMTNPYSHSYQPIPAETYTYAKNTHAYYDHPNVPTFETFTNLDLSIPVLTPEEMTDESYITRNGTRSNVRKGRAKEKGDPLLIAHKMKPNILKQRKKL